MVIFNHMFALGRIVFFLIFKRAIIIAIILGVDSFPDGEGTQNCC